MIFSKYEDYQRRMSSKWESKHYFLKEVQLINIFNWKNETIKFNSPVSLITGKNGIGKSTLINALKQVSDIQNGKYDFGILSLLEEYMIKLVNQDNNEFIVTNKSIEKQQFSLPKLEDLTFNSRLYAHYKNSTGTEMETYLETLRQYDSKSLTGDLLTVMKELIGKQIVSAEKIVDLEVQDISYLEYYRLKIDDGTIYDSYTMGSGEFYINQFLWGLDCLNEGSIIIIEELENFLHPEAQKKVLELIHKYSVKKKVQFILTTHSPTLIDHANINSRILIKIDSESNIICINDCSTWLAKDHLGSKVENKVEVLVEDEKAIRFFKAIISLKNPTIIKQLIITNGEGNSNIKKCIDINQKLESSKIIGIIDGDSKYDEMENLLKLPGEVSPEELVMTFIKDNYDKVAVKIDRSKEEVKAAFESARTLGDHHEWFSTASSHLGEDFDVLWSILVRMWCVEYPKETTAFFSKFESGFNKLK
ncbi:MAG: AAA family ATPase [Methanosarcinaceae archaeon]|nr:AAA family ATPase [Methanosarcinaceae archaeon]